MAEECRTHWVGSSGNCARNTTWSSRCPTLWQALLARVPLLDLQFFAAAVTLQRQTGGNISEVMAKLSTVIRECFALRGKVRAVSAHGKLTGLVLTFMPRAWPSF